MTKVVDNFALMEAVGSGQYGKVYRGRHVHNNQDYAVKCIPLEKFRKLPKLDEFTNNEISVLTQLVHPNIVRFYEKLRTNNNIYLVYEFCNGGNLEELIYKKGLPQKLALKYFRDMAEGFRQVAKRNILHRDIKPSNVLLHNGSAKIADFGFCKEMLGQQTMAQTMVGSPIYMAPELLRGQKYSEKADLWSLGVMLYEMLYKKCPFEERSIPALLRVLESQSLQFPPNISIPREVEEVLRGLLKKNHAERFSWKEFFAFYDSRFGGRYPQVGDAKILNRGHNQTISATTTTNTTNTTITGMNEGVMNNRRGMTIGGTRQGERLTSMSPSPPPQILRTVSNNIPHHSFQNQQPNQGRIQGIRGPQPQQTNHAYNNNSKNQYPRQEFSRKVQQGSSFNLRGLSPSLSPPPIILPNNHHPGLNRPPSQYYRDQSPRSVMNRTQNAVSRSPQNRNTQNFLRSRSPVQRTTTIISKTTLGSPMYLQKIKKKASGYPGLRKMVRGFEQPRVVNKFEELMIGRFKLQLLLHTIQKQRRLVNSGRDYAKIDLFCMLIPIMNKAKRVASILLQGSQKLSVSENRGHYNSKVTKEKEIISSMKGCIQQEYKKVSAICGKMKELLLRSQLSMTSLSERSKIQEILRWSSNEDYSFQVYKKALDVLGSEDNIPNRSGTDINLKLEVRILMVDCYLIDEISPFIYNFGNRDHYSEVLENLNRDELEIVYAAKRQALPSGGGVPR